MMWVVAILTMLVGSILAVRADRREADAGLLLDRPHRLPAHRPARRPGGRARSATDEITSLQAVLFYLATYGPATIGAFAIVTLVRDAGGEATSFAKWAGLGKRSPLVAGAFGFFLLSMAGIPLTAGFIGKWAVFRSRCRPGAWPVVLAAILSSIISVFFYVRLILLMFFTRPECRDGDGGDGGGGVATATRTEIATVTSRRCSPRRPSRSASLLTLLLGIVPGPVLDLAGGCRTIHQVNSDRRGSGASRHRPGARGAAARSAGAGREGALRARAEPVPVRHRGGLPPARRRRQAVPARCWCCSPPRPATTRTPTTCVTAACVVEITHVGSLYHDDVMDEAALRRGADSANARWDNLVAILTGDFLFAKSSELTARLGADAVRIQAETFTRLVEGQILETVEPGPDEDPLEHYLEVVAGKTGSLIATSARYGARFGGAPAGGRGGAGGVRRDRRLRLPALRRHPRRRLRLGRVRQDPRHRPARGRAHAAGADGPGLHRPRRRPAPRAARRPTSPTTTCHAEALALLRAHPAMDEARAYVVARADEAKARSPSCPTARSAPPSRPSPTSSRSAPPDADRRKWPPRDADSPDGLRGRLGPCGPLAPGRWRPAGHLRPSSMRVWRRHLRRVSVRRPSASSGQPQLAAAVVGGLEGEDRQRDPDQDEADPAAGGHVLAEPRRRARTAGSGRGTAAARG